MADAPVTSTPVGGEVSNSNTPTKVGGQGSPVNPPIPEAEQRHKIKINNQERELSTTELKALASKAGGAEEKFQKASQLEKKASAILESVKGKQLTQTLLKEGYSKQDIRSMLEAELTPFIEEELMSPEQREKKELSERLKRFEEQDQAAKNAELTAKEQAQLNAEMARLNDEFLGALEKVNLPRNPFLGKMVAQMMLGAEKNGYSMSAHEAAQLVNESFQKDVGHMFSNMDINKIKQFLGKDTLSKLRADDVKAVQDAESPFTKPTGKSPAVKQDKKAAPQAKIDRATFFNNMRGIKYNKE